MLEIVEELGGDCFVNGEVHPVRLNDGSIDTYVCMNATLVRCPFYMS